METANNAVIEAEAAAAGGEAEKENNAVIGEESAASKQGVKGADNEEGASAEVKSAVTGAEAATAESDKEINFRRIREANAKLREENAYLRGRNEAVGKGGSPELPVESVQSAKPAPDGYQSYDDYVEALTDWKAEEKVKSEFALRESANRADSDRRIMSQKIADAEKKYSDFKDVALNPEIPISGAMFEVIKDASDGTDIAYYLGKNPSEAARIAALPSYMAAMELGAIRTKLSFTPEPRRVTQAPVPIKTVTGTAQTGTPPDEMSVDDWMKWRESTLQQ